jgi:hypothetical protein
MFGKYLHEKNKSAQNSAHFYFFHANICKTLLFVMVIYFYANAFIKIGIGWQANNVFTIFAIQKS